MTFDNLVKMPTDPVAKLLSRANVLLKTPLEAPPTAGASQVLQELSDKGALVDLLRLLAILLPPRERVWWACLAARDYIGPKSDIDPPSLTTSEAWVFDPTDENRDAARMTLDHAYVDDDTVNCALAVLYADGTLGPGDLKQYPAPAGASETAAFAMNMVALSELSDKFEEHGQILVERAVNIGRGGNGQADSVQPANDNA
ncbi:hypothetical protein DL239_16750 [Sedimentitalea sp. CY04]|uniref:Uncharacterized protein n=1 Tax=Parasedimentitalea denitrificans TaxID=2211118 RepID=A0ABX0WCP3_9RHOB|nr:hypothetical protein [Sedimentitalea sp. CY04]NIZ62623.1 hypothetical protein [Sedimentitalea sp. CY04]